LLNLEAHSTTKLTYTGRAAHVVRAVCLAQATKAAAPCTSRNYLHLVRNAKVKTTHSDFPCLYSAFDLQLPVATCHNMKAPAFCLPMACPQDSIFAPFSRRGAKATHSNSKPLKFPNPNQQPKVVDWIAFSPSVDCTVKAFQLVKRLTKAS
jgi:hypothetical protein